MPAKQPSKPASQKSGEREVEINFPSVVQESLVFNRFHLEVDATFLAVKLAWDDEFETFPVFSGVISLREAKDGVSSFKSYVEKIGGPEANADYSIRSRLRFDNPFYFNHMGLAVQGLIGEVLIGHFSHKTAADASRAAEGKRTVSGSLIGAYTSTIPVHKKFVWDYIQLLSK